MVTDTGILTATQREKLRGEPQRDDAERRRRQYVREQVRNAIVRDAPLLLEDLRPDDRRQIFASQDVGSEEEAAAPSESERRQETRRIEPGSAALLAFLYTGLTERRSGEKTDSFDAILRHAMERVASRNGWILDEFEFTAEFDRDPDLEKLRRRFDEGTASIGEATELLRNDVVSSGEYAGYVQRR